MTYRNELDPLPLAHLRDTDEMAGLLKAIDHPSRMPNKVTEFVLGHADHLRTADGIKEIIQGTVGLWRSEQPHHKWTEVIEESSLVPDIANALTTHQPIALHGLFLATRK